MSPPDADHTIRAILDIHAMVGTFIVEAVEDVPESRMTEQPGGIVNHPAWTLSHLNAYAGFLLSMLEDARGPTPDAPPHADAEAEMTRYGYGTTPVADPAAYATKRDLLDRFKDRNARLNAVVAANHEATFVKPAPPTFQPHCPTIGHLAITLLVAHPPHHLGQLRQWRRAAGLSGNA